MFFIRKSRCEYPLTSSYDAENIVRKFENNTQKEVFTFNKIINKQDKRYFDQKRYMQSDAFWKDPHNAKMYEYGQKLADLKDKIPASIRKLIAPSYSLPNQKTIKYLENHLCKHGTKFDVIKDLNKLIVEYNEYIKKALLFL